MTIHTPGPWHVNDMGPARIIYDANGWAVADVKTFHGQHNSGASEANAHLIAASPELLDELRKAEAFIAGFEGDELQKGIADLLSGIRAAIDEAEGRS